MQSGFDARHEAFREEVRAFFDTALTEDLKRARRFMTSVYCDYESGMKWQRILLDKGWLTPSWPERYGGTGWSLTQRYIFNCERARANPPPVSPMGLAMLGPALLGCGTDAQRTHWLPQLAAGTAIGTLSLTSIDPRSASAAQGLEVEERAGGYRLRGEIPFVPDAARASVAIVPARAGGRDLVFALPTSTRGVLTAPMQALDLLRPLFQLSLDDVALPADALLGGGAAKPAGLQTLTDRALLLLHLVELLVKSLMWNKLADIHLFLLLGEGEEG